MLKHDSLRYTRLPLGNGAGEIPALGFGTLIPDPMATKKCDQGRAGGGIRALDSAERYRTEKEVGEAMACWPEGPIHWFAFSLDPEPPPNLIPGSTLLSGDAASPRLGNREFGGR
jgi:hypothetical protein